MARIISVVNQKGGVGKTTTAINLGAYLAEAGKFVLIVDLDPQANATSGIGVDHQTLEQGVYEAILGNVRMRDIVQPTAHETLRIAPATPALAGLNVELVSMDRREYKLHDALLEIRHDYDYILIDCPPTLGMITLNGIVAADEILIPVQAEYYALEGLGQLLETVNLVRDRIKPEIEVLGAVLTMYDSRTKLSDDVLQELYKHFPQNIFRSVIPRSVRLAEAPSFGRSIVMFDGSSKGAKAYERLAREVLDTELDRVAAV
ncbi:chromosome partitioning protein ParA [Candidatus Uhrbacteria bacterium RIFCSPHIGHO2_12_FULL_60_25]|uniref:Chromosome partitioning protein ParA n=1 Tax=Candidatus Uhrbacteria bacterium RIFCSPHIGHO2_12_FULL_60_25 TaxID=1802399 RepID=A0A1F7UM80_9BACT|nr:MAG: chromosome partitioning protein ParA [Candidatus Uhrbacteria bacterium RIFCSPHIGHO2_12_FULL_60_25]